MLDQHDPFELTVNGAQVSVRKNSPGQWTVYVHPDLDLIGSFTQEERDRATYFASEIPGEPGITEWVSDDPTTLISRMLTLQEAS